MKLSLTRSLAVFLTMFLMFSAIGVAPVHAAAELTVNTLADNETDDGLCTLREAIIAANTNADYYGCAAAGYGDDTITFSLSGTIVLGAALPTITAKATSGTLMIDGAGQAIVISGNHAVKIFSVNNGAALTLQNLTVADANTDFGGGGGVWSNGTLTVANCTFSDNHSNQGGGISAVGGTLTVSNSTFSGNRANLNGGGISNFGTLTVTNSTFSGNSASDINGGGIFNGASATLINTIVANNTAGGNCIGTITNGGNNIDDGITCGWGSVDGSMSSTDPLLGVLGNNGGPTQTMALLPGSPAIDAGDDAACAAAPVNNTSQNGIPRPQGAHCDIGSYEANVTLTFKSAGAQDGWILESSETSNVGGTLDSAATTFRLGDDEADKQYRAILHFDTSSLPDDAVITTVTLKIKKQGLVGTNPFTILGGLKVDMRKPYFGANAGLVIGDFQAAAGKSSVATFGATPVSNWYSAVLNATGRAYVNLTGTTQFRLRFATDDNDDNGADYMKFFSGNTATASARPTLIIEYYVP